MNFKLLSILIAFLFSGYAGYTSTTKIKGNAKNFEGKEISFYTYKDYLTFQKKDLGFTNIEKNGAYHFEFNLNKVKKVFLKIEDKTTWFFVEPGKVYNVNVLFDKDLNKQKIYDKELSLAFNFPVPQELNQQIKKINTQFDQFIDDNILALKKRDGSIQPKLNEFKTKMNGNKNLEKNSFLKNYSRYNMAIMETSLDISYTKKEGIKSSSKVNRYLAYLDKKPVLYNNPDYVKFFKEFFKGEIKDLSLELKGFDISQAINDKSSYEALSLALSKYPFLQNEEFKNFFILNGLLELSKDSYFTKSNINSILKQIEKSSKFSEHKIIAHNIIEKINTPVFGSGTIAPAFELKNNDKELISLAQFKGKPIYINFWTNWSLPSQKEMKIMQVLHKKYKNKIHFISICCDNEFDKMSNFLSKNTTYKWNFLHIGNNKKLLKKYHIRTFPTYVLLDQELNIYKFPAGRPGGTAERATEQNIEKEFYELTNPQ